MIIITLIGGLILLALAGDALVRGSISAAQRMHIPPIIIGLTVVAFGTSAPELIVSIEAALKGAPGLAIGNVVGSNMTNILLVLGLPALITPIVLVENGIRRSTIFMIAVSLGFAFMAMNGEISRPEGLLLFALLIVYLTYSGVIATRLRKKITADGEPEILGDKPLTTRKIVLLLTFGIIGLGLGGKLTTSGALGLAEMFNIADTAIGLTIIALGTSLPELATSAAAAFRKQTGVVIGNVIGSNIFNVLGITGITAMLVPLEVSHSIISFDIWIMLAASIVMIPIAFTTRRINRIGGILMTSAYIVYTVVVFRNGMAI